MTITIYSLSFVSSLLMASSALAENISNLTMECKGTYKVISATPYYTPAPTYPTRAPIEAYAGAKEQIKIVGLSGKDCEKLKPYYDIDLQIGMTLPYSVATSPATSEQSVAFAKNEMNKTYSFKVSQSFAYALPNGDLPFFPFIHSEQAFVLGLYGSLKSKALYGTPSLAELDDSNKKKIADQLLIFEDWGLIYKGTFHHESDQWLQLLISLDFENESVELEHIQNLVLVFNNMVKQTTQFYSSTGPNLVAKKVAVLLNKYGKSKWSTKLEILKMNPALLNDQEVIWSQPGEVLNLTSTEIEDFLTYALSEVQALSKVSQVYEAQVLKAQYQGAATALQSTPISQEKHFDLSPKSQELINLILSL